MGDTSVVFAIRQLGGIILRLTVGIVAVYFGHRLVRWSDERAKHRRDAEYALRLRQLDSDLSQLENEKRKGAATGE